MRRWVTVELNLCYPAPGAVARSPAAARGQIADGGTMSRVSSQTGNNSKKGHRSAACQGETMNARLSIIATTIFLLGATTQALGAINDWTAIGPTGGTVNKIMFNKATPSTVYAVATGGFHRSQDGGAPCQLIRPHVSKSPHD